MIKAVKYIIFNFGVDSLIVGYYKILSEVGKTGRVSIAKGKKSLRWGRSRKRKRKRTKMSEITNRLK